MRHLASFLSFSFLIQKSFNIHTPEASLQSFDTQGQDKENCVCMSHQKSTAAHLKGWVLKDPINLEICGPKGRVCVSVCGFSQRTYTKQRPLWSWPLLTLGHLSLTRYIFLGGKRIQKSAIQMTRLTHSLAKAHCLEREKEALLFRPLTLSCTLASHPVYLASS